MTAHAVPNPHGEVPSPAVGVYDPVEAMVRCPQFNPGYHTTLTGEHEVHATRESFEYAADLFASATPAARERGETILRRVIALQDENPNSPTWGIWPWFLEEPLEQMDPPDWNWADFCGVNLLEIALGHGKRMDSNVSSMVNNAICHAAGSVRRRDVNLDYTNIAVKGTYVALAAGLHLGDDDLTRYALDRLDRFYRIVTADGGFHEYNSPYYTLVTLDGLARLRQVAPAGRPREQVDALYFAAWQEVADHFHPPTCQWAGPHSRSYRTLLETDVLHLIQQESRGTVTFRGLISADSPEYRPPRPIPEPLLEQFRALDRPRRVISTRHVDKRPITLSSYLHPTFALGTVTDAQLWSQQRPMLAHWGTAENPAYMRVRFLCDGRDLHAARLRCVQNDGRALAAVTFATDGGIVHSNFDKLDRGRLPAEDLRLRFELGGSASSAPLAAPTGPGACCEIIHAGVRMRLTPLIARFGAEHSAWQTGRTGEVAHLDLVLYHGKRQTHDLLGIVHAVAAFALEMVPADEELAEVSMESVHLQGNRLALRWSDLAMTIATNPVPRATSE